MTDLSGLWLVGLILTATGVAGICWLAAHPAWGRNEREPGE